jgi:hypothetical protein
VVIRAGTKGIASDHINPAADSFLLGWRYLQQIIKQWLIVSFPARGVWYDLDPGKARARVDSGREEDGSAKVRARRDEEVGKDTA